jgi:lipoprotein NlpD
VSAARESRSRSGASAAIRLCVSLVCLAALIACSSTTSLPVSRREAREAVHVVKSGETLYKIAWQHRVDQQELAAWNGIRNPDELRVGQRLRLVPPRGYVAAAPAPAARAPETTRQSSSPPRSSPSSTSSTRSTPPPAARPPASRSTAPNAAPPPRWAWPTDGAIVTRFGADAGIASGIGISGREGQPVRAAAAGRIVYAGGGLIGYGQLVIIKHDETFLSAYGYNAELLVTQGQDVARGATIARMGQGPNRQPRLHFEIRRNGTPVDPLLFVTAPRWRFDRGRAGPAESRRRSSGEGFCVFLVRASAEAFPRLVRWSIRAGVTFQDAQRAASVARTCAACLGLPASCHIDEHANE